MENLSLKSWPLNVRTKLLKDWELQMHVITLNLTFNANKFKITLLQSVKEHKFGFSTKQFVVENKTIDLLGLL